MREQPEKESSFWQLSAAWFLTVVWLFGIGVVMLTDYCGFEWPKTLNEWGDFASGAFAPIAFLWLVVAVLLQTTELGEQRKELTLTRDELKKQLEAMDAQKGFVENQTKIMRETWEATVAEQNYRDVLGYLAAFLRLYKNGWILWDGVPNTQASQVIKPKMELEGLSDELVVRTVTRNLRRLKGPQEKSERKDAPLHAEFPHDLRRMMTAINDAQVRLADIQNLDQAKRDAIEVHVLHSLAEYFLGRVVNCPPGINVRAGTEM